MTQYAADTTRPAVLVTGGAGFIGSHLVDALLARGERVRVIDDLSTGRLTNLTEAMSHIDFQVGDIRNPSSVLRAMRGVGTVYHQAALPSVTRSVRDPLRSHEVNVTGTLNVLVAARDSGVRRVVVASSSSIYGDTPTLPKHEELRPEPRSPYAVSKLATEQYALNFAALYPLEAVALRYFNVYGPRQDASSHYAGVIARFCAAALDGEPCTIYGDGTQSRDFTYVADVVQANLLAAEARPANGRAFNIACGARTSLLEILDCLSGVFNQTLRRSHERRREGDVQHSLADISRAQQLLGYQPQVGFRDGLTRTLAWYAGQTIAP
jgi:UDP-glucose 4-epimerase